MITHEVEIGQRVRGTCSMCKNKYGYISRQKIIFDVISTYAYFVNWDDDRSDWYGRGSLEVISKEEEEFMDKVRDRME